MMNAHFKPRLLTILVLAAIPGAVDLAFAGDYSDGHFHVVKASFGGQDINVSNKTHVDFDENPAGTGLLEINSLAVSDSKVNLNRAGNIGPVTTTNSNVNYGTKGLLRISDDNADDDVAGTVDMQGGTAIFDNVLIENKASSFAIEDKEIYEGAGVAITGAAKSDNVTFGPKAIVRSYRTSGSGPITAKTGEGVIVKNYQGKITANQSQITGGQIGLHVFNQSPESKASQIILNQAKVNGGTLAIDYKGNGLLTINGGVISNTIDIGTAGENQSNIINVVNGASVTSDGFAAGLNIYDNNSTQWYSNKNTSSQINIADSSITGGSQGILIHAQDETKSDKKVTLNLNHALITSTRTTGDAIYVRSTGTTINIANGTQLHGGATGNALHVYNGASASVNVNNSALNGNVINKGTTSISLANSASWTGTMQNVTGMNLATGTALNLTGNSTIGSLANGGAVSLANGHNVGTVLTVGNYSGNNGNLLFNTALGGDKSATDKLVITGNAAGTTNVSVNNIGGTGAKTVDGIEIIHVDGTSTANAFKQKGRIVAGAYDYKLMNRNNSWYLDSHNTGLSLSLSLSQGLGPDPKPTPIHHVVRPEAGSYIANQAASSMFLTTLHDRAGENRYMNALDAEGNVTSLWLRQVGNHNQFHDNSGQLKTTGNTYVAQLGGDLAQWSSTDHDRFHLGLMAGYGNNKNNTRSGVSGYSSKGSVTGYSAGLYGTWYQHDADKTGAYVDGQLMYSWFNNHVNGDAIAAESYKSKGLTASVETGYTFAVGQSGAADNPTGYFIEPQAQVTWMGVKADDLTESNGTRISTQGNDNVQTRLGMRAFMQGHNRIDNGKSRSFQPFVEVNWLHNTKRNGVAMNGVSLEQAGATNIGEVKLGLEGQLTKRTQLWGNVGQQIGDKGYSDTTAMVGVKYNF